MELLTRLQARVAGHLPTGGHDSDNGVGEFVGSVEEFEVGEVSEVGS